jgi:hypothetical protein
MLEKRAPLLFHTTGSNIGALSNPVWCGINEPVNTTQFKWGSLTGTTLTTNTAYNRIFVSGPASPITPTTVFLEQKADSTLAFAVCEQYDPYE